MRFRSSSGQASVELVALLPFVVVVAAGLWQAALCGQAVWAGAAAARAGARASAVGADVDRAALRVLPARLRPGARVLVSDSDGAVEIRVPVRVLTGDTVLWMAVHRARFEDQR